MADKSSQAFRSIGEMAREIGVKTHILRYWEEQLPMLQPMKRPGGRRLFRPEDAAMLHQIRHLVCDQGYTVKGARRMLEKSRGANDGEKAQAVGSGDRADATGASAANIAAAGLAAGQIFPLAELKIIRARLSAALAGA